MFDNITSNNTDYIYAKTFAYVIFLWLCKRNKSCLFNFYRATKCVMSYMESSYIVI